MNADGGNQARLTTDPAPETAITREKINPPKRKAKFAFAADETGSSSVCRLDKKPFKDCTSPTRCKRLKGGKHRFQVKATDGAGNDDASAATARFKIKRS